MIAGDGFDDDGLADEQVILNVDEDDRYSLADDVHDGETALDALRRRWAAMARREGRLVEAEALEHGRYDPLAELRALPDDDVPFKGER